MSSAPGSPGLAAAVRLAEARAPRSSLHEAADHAGGRCRSYYDPALGLRSSTTAIICCSRAITRRSTYLDASAPTTLCSGRRMPSFDFADLATASAGGCGSMTGGCPGGCSRPGRRVPGTARCDYLGAWRLLTRRPRAPASARSWPAAAGSMTGSGGPLLLAALNTEPEPASAPSRRRDPARDARCAAARPAGRCGGARACPTAFIDPALAYLQAARRRRCASATGCAGSFWPRDGVPRARFRRGGRGAGARRCGDPCGARARGARRCCRAHGAGRIPRHRQCPFPDRRRRRAGRRSSASSAARSNGCSPSRIGCRSRSAAPTG